jgi:hypothetical protein
MAPEEVYEIRVRPVKELSPQAQKEVNDKLSSMDSEFLGKYKGFASVTYVTASPLRVKSVDPIEGDFGSLFAKIMARSNTAAPSTSA